ncbi:MAG: hypothetical protein AAFY15_14820, partial [Cyanobacteria bacterium J06648_11]
MDWEPIGKADLLKEIDRGYRAMSPPQKRLWKAICIAPRKWHQHPWGDEGGGFWVVAILGETAIWYNDIEEGFNRSRYSEYGTLDDYWCNQDELNEAMQHLFHEIQMGARSGYHSKP